MKLNFLTQYKKSTQLLINNIGYLGDTLYCFNLTKSRKVKYELIETDKARPIMVIARKYYFEKWHTYPAVSKKELSNILALQKKNDKYKTIHKVIENKEHDGFDVKIITFKKEQLSLLSDNVILLPETELLSGLENKNERVVSEIVTPNGVIFWAYSNAKVYSAYKAGLLNNVGGFIQSIGLSSECEQQTITQESYADRLMGCIESSPVNELFDISSINLNNLINVNQLHYLYLGPLAVATLFVLLSNSYLYIEKINIEDKILTSNSTTSKLLNKKKEIESIEHRAAMVSNEFKKIKATHIIWDIVAQAIESGMEISKFRRSSKGIELRGRADKASTVLNRFNNIPSVKSATFQGSISKSRGQELFTVILQLNPRISQKVQEGETN